MKLLAILRHAKTEPHRPGDFDRALTERGIDDARRMGAFARTHDLAFDYVLASPARRTTQTIELFRDAYGPAMPLPRYETAIYDASLVALMNVVRNLPDSAETAIVCGHNPAMQAIVTSLAATSADDAGESDLGAVRAKFPTAALALLHCNIEQWSALAPDCARLALFQTPKTLA